MSRAGHCPRLRRMVELAMATLCANQPPTVLFRPLYHVANFQRCFPMLTPLLSLLQFLSVFPVFSVNWILSWVFFSPHSDLNPSSSRSRMYCSLTGVPGVTFPPHSTSATLVLIFTSWSLMYSPCRIR